MSHQRQGLVRGGCLYTPTDGESSYLTYTLPFFHPRCYILAATSPTTPEASPRKDGWFLSDFFAFNALLKGVGSEQTWLTVAKIDKLVSKQELLHGNPYREPRVVLSRELLDTGKITKPVEVQPGHLKAEFTARATSLSKRAAQEGVPLVLFLFCHGSPAPSYEFHLDGTSRVGLRPLELRGVLDPAAQVVLVTTACYAGGWMIDTNLNKSIASAARHDKESISWPLLYPLGHPGSIFASSLIKALTSATSPLVDQSETTTTHEAKPLQPETPTEVQTLTYNAFCNSIWETCMSLTRMANEHEFAFACVDDGWGDSWPGVAGIPLNDYQNDYQKRWNELPVRPYTGPSAFADQDPANPIFQQGLEIVRHGAVPEITGALIENMRCHNVKALAHVFAQYTCPGDWNRGRNIAYHGMLLSCAQGERPGVVKSLEADNEEYDWTDQIDVYASIMFRWEWAALTDFIVHGFGLPRPNNEDCLFWNRSESDTRASAQCDTIKQQLATTLRSGGFCSYISPTQGPEFTRPVDYVVAAIVQADLQDSARDELVQHIIAFIRKVQIFEEARLMRSVMHSPNVRNRARTWLMTLGDGLRLVSERI